MRERARCLGNDNAGICLPGDNKLVPHGGRDHALSSHLNGREIGGTCADKADACSHQWIVPQSLGILISISAVAELEMPLPTMMEIAVWKVPRRGQFR